MVPLSPSVRMAAGRGESHFSSLSQRPMDRSGCGAERCFTLGLPFPQALRGRRIPFTCTGVKMAVPLPKWGRSPCVQSFQRGSLRSRILWSSRLGVSFYIFESKGFTVRSRSLPSVSPPATTGERPGLYRSPQARRGRRRICCCTPPERFCVHTASVWGIEREFEL